MTTYVPRSLPIIEVIVLPSSEDLPMDTSLGVEYWQAKARNSLRSGEQGAEIITDHLDASGLKALFKKSMTNLNASLLAELLDQLPVMPLRAAFNDADFSPFSLLLTGQRLPTASSDRTEFLWNQEVMVAMLLSAGFRPTSRDTGSLPCCANPRVLKRLTQHMPQNIVSLDKNHLRSLLMQPWSTVPELLDLALGWAMVLNDDTLLSFATVYGHETSVKWVLNHTDLTPEVLNQALCQAITSGWTHLLPALHNSGVDLNQPWAITGNLPLHQAALEGFSDVVQALWGLGATMDVPLAHTMIAAAQGVLNVPEFLATPRKHAGARQILAMVEGRLMRDPLLQSIPGSFHRNIVPDRPRVRL